MRTCPGRSPNSHSCDNITSVRTTYAAEADFTLGPPGIGPWKNRRMIKTFTARRVSARDIEDTSRDLPRGAFFVHRWWFQVSSRTQGFSAPGQNEPKGFLGCPTSNEGAAPASGGVEGSFALFGDESSIRIKAPPSGSGKRSPLRHQMLAIFLPPPVANRSPAPWFTNPSCMSLCSTLDRGRPIAGEDLGDLGQSSSLFCLIVDVTGPPFLL